MHGYVVGVAVYREEVCIVFVVGVRFRGIRVWVGEAWHTGTVGRLQDGWDVFGYKGMRGYVIGVAVYQEEVCIVGVGVAG